MQITDTNGAELTTAAATLVTSDGTHDQHSLESLCQVWRLSRTDPLPHICSSISNVVHINGSGHDDNIWSPISHNLPSSFYSDTRNISITAALLLAFTFLLFVSIYLAVKYRRKSVESDESGECEMDRLTRDGRKAAGDDTPPPEYHAVMMSDNEDMLPPDYNDDLVNKNVR